MVIISAVICSSSGQGWRGSWGVGSRYGILRRNYRIPVAEPEPEPELFRKLSLTNPYKIPLPEPEPEPIQRRLSRRLISTQNQNIIKSIKKPTTPTTIVTTTQRSLTLTTLVSTMDRRTNILKLLEESFPKAKQKQNEDFGEIFVEPASPKPWAINPAKFDIVPAVPAEDAAEVLTVINKNKENPFQVPRQFSPVLAVPEDTQDIDRQPKTVLQLNDVGDLENSFTSAKKKILPRKCIEKCVDHFCISKDDLNIYQNCENKCNTFCQ